MTDAPEPVDDEVLEDLRRRLRATRFPALPDGHGWDRGTDPGVLRELVADWADRYDWRPHEARIRALPWTRAGDLRVVRQSPAESGGPTVVLLHGWPDSVLRFERVLPLLADLDVVVPALPGYPFSDPMTGMSTTAMADAVAVALDALGVGRCVVSGGDIGSAVAEGLAVRHPDRVAAVHLTDVPISHARAMDPSDLTDAERDYVDRARRWTSAEGGYMHEQSTKPHTLAAALADSPAGLLAWIVEKLRAWSDGDDPDRVFGRDDLLTWVTAYWVTGAIGTSFSPYVEPRPAPRRVEVPVAFTVFPADTVPAPREAAERHFDVRSFDTPPAGGHFGPFEQPAAFAAGVRAAVALA